MKIICKGFPIRNTIKAYPLRMTILLLCLSLITSCQAVSEKGNPAIGYQSLTVQPVGQTNVHTISITASPEQRTHWKSYPNINWVTQIAVDQNGNIWTAGRGGITRWNPKNSIAETFSASDGIPGNYATALLNGPDNKLWIGTYSGRIVEYSNGKFTTLPGILGDTITCLAISADGKLWIGTNRGVYSYDGKNLQNYSTRQGLLDNYIQSISVTSQGAVWVGVMGGVSFFDGKNWKSTKLTKGDFVSNIVEAPDKTLWLTSASSLTHYDGQIWTTYPMEQSVGNIAAITITPQGVLWLGGLTSGLIRFDEEKQQFIKYPIANISSITSSPNGGLWLGTYDAGIAYFNGRDLNIYQPENTPINNFITSSALSADGSLWFGTFQGVSRYDGRKWQSYTTSNGLIDDGILSITASPDGSVWIGTDNGISNFDGTTWKTANLNGLPGNRIDAIAVPQNGTVWAVSNNNLFQFDGSHWNAVPIPTDVPINSVSGIASARDGSLWVITTMGVLRFDGNNWILFRFPGMESAACLAVSEKGDVWIGTRDAGIFFLDGKLWSQVAIEHVRSVLILQPGQVEVTTDAGNVSINVPYWRAYTKADGLLSNSINKIVIGKAGEAWVTTDKGISNLNTDGKWINYTEASGLGNDFVQTLVLDPQGRVWAGMPLGGIAEYVP
jgi:ligand-binding sensor domain-containing protein